MFIGIDPSLTGTGIVLIDNSVNIHKTIKLSTPAMGVERLFHLENKLLEFLDSNTSIDLVCIEGGAYKETGKIFELGEWSGIIKLNLYKRGIPYLKVAPLQLKKFVSGVGKNQGKQVVILDVFKNFGEEIRDADIADAYVLARIAHAYHCSFESNVVLDLKRYQIDVIKNLYIEHANNNKLI